MDEWNALRNRRRRRSPVSVPAAEDRRIEVLESGEALQIAVLGLSDTVLAGAVLDRARVEELRDELTRWLESAPPDAE